MDEGLNQSSLAEQARAALREQIISGKLKPNERIDLAELAKKWSISPTPLRDAVRNLEMSGLVHIHPRRGVFVATLDRTGLRETFELRIALEGMAARLTTPRLAPEQALATLERYRRTGAARGPQKATLLVAVDNLVHDLVFENCGNQRLQRIMESVRDLVAWSKQSIIRNVPEPYDATLPEHIAICEALVSRDPDAAESMMRRHLLNSLARLNDFFDRHARPDNAAPPAGEAALT